MIRSRFVDVDAPALERCIAAYQRLGCWQSSLAITPEDLAVTLDVFEHCGAIDVRYAWDRVCALPPGGQVSV